MKTGLPRHLTVSDWPGCDRGDVDLDRGQRQRRRVGAHLVDERPGHQRRRRPRRPRRWRHKESRAASAPDAPEYQCLPMLLPLSSPIPSVDAGTAPRVAALFSEPAAPCPAIAAEMRTLSREGTGMLVCRPFRGRRTSSPSMESTKRTAAYRRRSLVRSDDSSIGRLDRHRHSEGLVGPSRSIIDCGSPLVAIYHERVYVDVRYHGRKICPFSSGNLLWFQNPTKFRSKM